MITNQLKKLTSVFRRPTGSSVSAQDPDRSELPAGVDPDEHDKRRHRLNELADRKVPGSYTADQLEREYQAIQRKRASGR